MLYGRTGGASLWETLRSVKDTSQDAATTSKVKTALLLSKHVSTFDIKATTSQGEVTLTGEVPTEGTRRLAGAIAQDTSGVAQVRNNLTVNPGAERNSDMANLGERVADLEIKTIIIDQLAQNPELKDKGLTVQVTKRIVTLDGTVDSPAQKRAADQIAIQVSGVQGLAGQLIVTNTQTSPESADDKLARGVEFELYSTRAVSLKNVQIRSQGGTVILTGAVTSRAEKLLAERVTQSVPGVKRVVNNLNAPEELSR
ncbi:MAG TPA: BON domain-containing protein [Methylomirabilota bacterium]|nr:BON domain-containing protein [Methylomirabilota bacterium]